MSDPATESQRAAAPAAVTESAARSTEPESLEARLADYAPETYHDFSDPDTKARMEAAIDEVESQLGREYPNRIGGDDVRLEEKQRSTNPADPEQVVGVFPRGDEAHADRAVEAADEAFHAWRDVPAVDRADFLFRAADIMRRRRLELAAWMVWEVGKAWAEADADVAEAIDFCDYYARLMMHYAYDPYPLAEYPPEEDEVVYLPLGPGAIIPPWNFPLAITTGMTVAAIVAGNPVVLKPAGEAMTIAWKLVEVMDEAGLPAGVLNFVTGPGTVVGRRMVEHPLVRFVSFTGSKQVGLEIVERAAVRQPGQMWIKRVIAEMGGKDAIIVDADADLDEAVEGVAVSAFGYQGQKCSACSRAIVDEAIYDEFLRRLVQRAGRIEPGKVTEGAWMGPVVSKSQFDKVTEYIEIGKNEGALVLGSKADDSEGWFIQPTIFAGVDPRARIAQEEIFGPVLAVIEAKDYDDALAIANDTEYGLTGGVYTTDPEKIERAKREFHVGNLYINRKCTGALVGVHPFGGFQMSGTDSKAGGKDYLLFFLQPKSIARKKD
ncbi:MAG: L-glutamate gamma-semialdehyde dehydrogenase [Gemmatimonadetes bacterium]|nr:L-glutamate gamma-semialdehyde dehydrogenase [Gemmatimonadota bacterium]